MAKLPDPGTALGQRPTPQVSGPVQIPGSTEIGQIISQSGSSLEAAAHSLGKAGNEIYHRQKIEQAKQDTVRAEDAFTKLRETQLDLTIGEENGFSKVKGGAADNTMLTTWSKRFKDSADEIEQTLQNDEQKLKFRQRAAATGIQFQHELLSHIARESDVFAKETFDGSVRTEIRNASARWNDPEAAGLSISRVNAVVAERASAMNWPKEYEEAVRLQEVGKIHSAIVGQAIASGDWKYAQEWFKENKADVDPQTAKVLEKAVEDGTQKQLSAGYTSELLANRDNRKGLEELERRISADGTLDETRKNAILGRVMARGETLDRRAEAEVRTRERLVERSINQINANTLAGFEPNLEQLTPILNAARGTSFEAEARQMVQLANATRTFRLATPQAQEAYLTKLEAEVRKDPGKLDIKWVNAFREIHQKQQTAVQADPQTFAVRQGLLDSNAPAAQPLDLTKPEALGDQLTARFAVGRGMADRYQAPFKPLTKEETDFAVGTLKSATVDQKRTFFAGLAQSSRGDMDGYRAVMAQLAPDDPVTAHGGVMAGRGYQTKDGEIVVGRGTYIADLIFRGQALMNPNKKEDGKPTHGKSWPMPAQQDEKSMLSTFESEEKGSLAGLGTGRENYIQTSKAIYAALSEDAKDATGVLDNNRWRQAVKLATGGFTDVGGKRIILPYGYTESQFKDGLAKRVEAVADRLPDTVSAKKLQDLPLAIAGDGRYMFRSGDAVVLDKNNQPLVIDFNRSAPFKSSGKSPAEQDAADAAALDEIGKSWRLTPASSSVFAVPK